MIFFTKIISAITDKVRNLKVNRLGGYDPVTPAECAPAGFDGNPVAGMKAIYAETLTSNGDLIIGYINTQLLAEPGESRIYATDADGVFKFNIWLRADGTCLLGTSNAPADYINHMVQWEALNTEMQSSIVAFINGQLGLIATAITGLGGVYTPGTMSIDISTAKLNNLKVQ